jgi:hypothetical protein
VGSPGNRNTVSSKIDFVLPVWGEEYIGMFLRAGLPSQFAAGNLPAVPEHQRGTYHIFTREADVALLDHAAMMARLRSLMNVQIHFVAPTAASTHGVMSEAYRRGLRLACQARCQAALLTPDLVFADGTFAWMQTARRSGARLVFMASLRTLSTEVLPLLQLRASKTGSLEIPPRVLVDLALRHLHPLTRNHFWSGEGRLHPANLIWPVGEEGVLLHAFHLHPLLVEPNEAALAFAGTLDEDLVILVEPDPDAAIVAQDSDAMFALELCHPGRTTPLIAEKESIADTAAWAVARSEPWHRKIARRPIRVHAVEPSQTLWSEVEKKAATVLAAIDAQLERPAILQALAWPLAWLRRSVRRGIWARYYGEVGFSPAASTGLPAPGFAAQLFALLHSGYRRLRSPIKVG